MATEMGKPALAPGERPCFSLAFDSQHRVLLSEPNPPSGRSVFLFLGPGVSMVTPPTDFKPYYTVNMGGLLSPYKQWRRRRQTL